MISDVCEPCDICGRDDFVTPRPSILDPYTYQTCQACVDNHAESWVAVANALRGSSWKDLDTAIRSAVAVWSCGEYMSVIEGGQNLLRQQVVIFEPSPHPDFNEELCDLDEATYQAVRRRIMSIDMPGKPFEYAWPEHVSPWRRFLNFWGDLIPGLPLLRS